MRMTVITLAPVRRLGNATIGAERIHITQNGATITLKRHYHVSQPAKCNASASASSRVGCQALVYFRYLSVR